MVLAISDSPTASPRRLTLFGNIPIVYVRSRIKTTFDPTTSKVGVNPANAKIGTSAGLADANLFIAQFDVALDTLRNRVQGNFYTGTSATLAQQSITAGATMRAALYRLLLDPIYASAILPVSSDPLATQLLAKITTLQGTMNGTLALPASAQFTDLPDFPTASLTSDDFDKLLNEPTALGQGSPNNLPTYGIGDMSAGLAFELMRRGSPSAGSWTTAWIRATAHFPNATAPDPTILLDQGTGTRDKALQLDGILELGRRDSAFALRRRTSISCLRTSSPVRRHPSNCWCRHRSSPRSPHSSGTASPSPRGRGFRLHHIWR